MPKKKQHDGKPQVHDELQGFEININEFGEISANMNIDEMNRFLDRHVDDKKLRHLNPIEHEVEEKEE